MAKTILVVEDDQNISELLRLYLEKEGYTVNIADDGGKGVELYRRLKPGILTTKNERSHLDMIDIQHECEAVVITGGCCSMSQIIEVWPELVSELEVTGERLTGGAASMSQTAEVWPELTEQIEATTELDRGGGTAASQVVEIYPEGGG